MTKPIASEEEPRKSGKRESFIGLQQPETKQSKPRIMKSPSERVLMKPLRGSMDTGFKYSGSKRGTFKLPGSHTKNQ